MLASYAATSEQPGPAASSVSALLASYAATIDQHPAATPVAYAVARPIGTQLGSEAVVAVAEAASGLGNGSCAQPFAAPCPPPAKRAPDICWMAAADQGCRPSGMEAVRAVAAATSDIVERSYTQPHSFAPPPPRKKARTCWSAAEDAALLKHVAQYGTEQWDLCAETVGGGRTYGAVHHRWDNYLKNTNGGRAAIASAMDVQHGTRWTDAKDETLLEHVALYGARDWVRIAEALGRGASSVESRWHKYLKATDRGQAALHCAPSLRIRSPSKWTDMEDAMLLEHVRLCGPQDWSRCAKVVGGGRTWGAMSQRWHNHLKDTDRGRAVLVNAPMVRREARIKWTDADDAALLEHVAQYGPGEWSRCAQAVGGSRTFDGVKLRWYRDLRESERGRAALASAPLPSLPVAYQSQLDRTSRPPPLPNPLPARPASDCSPPL